MEDLFWSLSISSHKNGVFPFLFTFLIFFYQGFFHGNWLLTIPFYHFHPLTNIQTFILPLLMWDDYHIFLIAPLVFTRVLLDEFYHLIELPLDWLMMWCYFFFLCLLDDLILDFCYSNLGRESGDYHYCITSEPTNKVC